MYSDALVYGYMTKYTRIHRCVCICVRICIAVCKDVLVYTGIRYAYTYKLVYTGMRYIMYACSYALTLCDTLTHPYPPLLYPSTLLLI